MIKHMTLHFLFWNQLSEELLYDVKSEDIILLIESYHDCQKFCHHKKKLVFFISAMRHFYESIKHKYNIQYLKTNESITSVMHKFMYKNHIDSIKITRPGSYDDHQSIQNMCVRYGYTFTCVEDTRFFCSIYDFQEHIKKYKKPIMEHFYRHMRKTTKILMLDGKPCGNKWNYDHENRSKIDIPHINIDDNAVCIDDITSEVIKLVENKFNDNFGDIHPFWLATTHKEADEHFQEFLNNRLQFFGKYQDAMSNDHAFMYHSRVSAYLNIGLLSPMYVCAKVEEAYHQNQITIQSAEGFIRQILGWREFIRGIYWTKMPQYAQMNFFNANEPLPDFYWSGNTEMNCLKKAILDTKKFAYSHHIQRLMLTGNYAMVTGVNPHELHKWYLCVYADAHEWVEMPNTIGMASYADGGIVGTKPYACTANYINKMSNLCKYCKYNHKQRSGPNACPFNKLYWDFFTLHKEKLHNNARLYHTYKRVIKQNMITSKNDR